MELDELKRTAANNEALRRAADSADARALAARFDGRRAEAALKAGDTAALEALLRQVLATPEGQRLADTVKHAVDRNG